MPWKDAEGRRESSVRTHDALARKARAAHVTGGRVFGYRNVDVFAGVDAHGRPIRSHVTREVRDDEAAVVRQIFERCAARYGVKRIAAQLNESLAPCPRAQQARRDGWAASSVRTVLFRTLYRRVVTWNRTRKRNAFGQVQQRPRDRHEWLQVDVPEYRIVSDDLWQAAHARLDRARQNYLAGTHGVAWGVQRNCDRLVHDRGSQNISFKQLEHRGVRNRLMQLEGVRADRAPTIVVSGADVPERPPTAVRATAHRQAGAANATARDRPVTGTAAKYLLTGRTSLFELGSLRDMLRSRTQN